MLKAIKMNIGTAGVKGAGQYNIPGDDLLFCAHTIFGLSPPPSLTQSTYLAFAFDISSSLACLVGIILVQAVLLGCFIGSTSYPFIV